jgi:hypothetical protein
MALLDDGISCLDGALDQGDFFGAARIVGAVMSSAFWCTFLSVGPDIVRVTLGRNHVIALLMRRQRRGLGDGFAISRITSSSPSIGCRPPGSRRYAGLG